MNDIFEASPNTPESSPLSPNDNMATGKNNPAAVFVRSDDDDVSFYKHYAK